MFLNHFDPYIDEETLENEILTPEFDLSEFTKALDFSKDLLKEESKEVDYISLADSDQEFEEMERLASLESEDAFNELNKKEAQKIDSSCQSNKETLTQEPVIIDTIHKKESVIQQSSADVMCSTRVSFPDQEPSIEDTIEASLDIVPPPLVDKSSNDTSIEDSIKSNLAGESEFIISTQKIAQNSANDVSFEDSIETYISAPQRKGSIHDAPEISTFIDQEKCPETTTPHDSSPGHKVTENRNPFVDEDNVSENPFENDIEPEESSKNSVDEDESVTDDIKEENSSSPEPIFSEKTLAPASQAEDLLSRLKDTTEIDVDSIKYENFSNTSSDQAIDVRPSSSANDADSSDGDLERLAVKIDESGNVMNSDGESSIELIDEEEKTKREEMMKQEELIHKRNEEVKKN